MVTNRVLKLLVDAGLESVRCEFVSVDTNPYALFDDTSTHTDNRAFEHPATEAPRAVCVPADRFSILRYFLDGSRKTYRIGLAYDQGRLLPLIAAQVGVAVVQRDPKCQKITPFREYCTFRNLLAVPHTIANEDLKSYQRTLSDHSPLPISLVKYTVKEKQEPQDSATIVVMDEMRNLEISTVYRMAEDGCLTDTALLVRDGPLEFQSRLDKAKFRNVIGISKSFLTTPKVKSGTKKQDVGMLAASLRFAHRSLAYRYEYAGNQLAHWYLRIHHGPPRVSTPLDGVIKISRLASDAEEEEQGMHSDTIDTLSSHILRERNVTAYGKDARWANHLYPIFLAEEFLKSSFLSDLAFRGYF